MSIHLRWWVALVVPSLVSLPVWIEERDDGWWGEGVEKHTDTENVVLAASPIHTHVSIDAA